MAGETPRAHNLGKQKKKKLNWQDDRSTDKYYGSGNPSAIQHTHGDTVGRPGDPPKPVPVNPAKVDERNADKKYYANPPVAPTVQQRAKSGQLPMPGGAPLPVNSPRQRLAAPSSINKVVIATVDELHDKMERLCDMLSGDNHVVVEVPNSDLLRRARAKLDTMVTRELLTEELARDVRFSKIEASATPAPALDLSKPPEPAADVSVDERDGDFLDPAAVLSGAVNIDEPVVDTTPVNVTEAEVADEPEAADDDGDDFLAPQAAATTEETTTVEDSSSTETPADSDDEETSSSVETASPETSSSDEAATDESSRPKKPGRRSGRGMK